VLRFVYKQAQMDHSEAMPSTGRVEDLIWTYHKELSLKTATLQKRMPVHSLTVTLSPVILSMMECRTRNLIYVNGTLSFVSPRLFQIRTRSVSNGKSSRSETYYTRLSGLCFTIRPSFQSTENSGCSPDQSYTTYKEFNKNDFVSFEIPVDVRSIYDPFVKANSLTGGSFFFGVSMVNKLIVGCVMFIIGVKLYDS